jgi:hypothetical protein
MEKMKKWTGKKFNTIRILENKITRVYREKCGREESRRT